MKILLSGYLFRDPHGGGQIWHHLQYLVGFQRMGHEVYYLEEFGWKNSSYNAAADVLTSDPSYGILRMSELLSLFGLSDRWCFLAENGQAYGMTREKLASVCGECDVYVNLSGIINWVPELALCRRRVLVDTDPAFTQIGAHGMGGPFSRYHTLFSYGENVHRSGCEMPTGGFRWLPTRQPVVLDLWEPKPVATDAPITTVMNWSSYGEHKYKGRIYGQKGRQFEPYFSIPLKVSRRMDLAVANAPWHIRWRLRANGWGLADAAAISRTPWTYQEYLSKSAAEFSVAKHAYVSTHSGWFSERSAGYLASGRPVIVEDTGFSKFLPCGKGLFAFRTAKEATASIKEVLRNYPVHEKSARALAEECFDASKVLSDLLTLSL